MGLILRLLLSAIIIAAYSVAFWQVVVVWIGWESLKIGTGLGGAVYPMLFMPPLLVSLLVYYAVCYAWFSRKGLTRGRFYAITLGVPLVVTSVLLVAFCPMDGPGSFAVELFARLIH